MFYLTDLDGAPLDADTQQRLAAKLTEALDRPLAPNIPKVLR